MATNELGTKEIVGLKRILSLLEPDNLTKEEFKKQWTIVLTLVKKLKDENSKTMSDFAVLVKKIEGKLNGDNSGNLANIKADFKTELSGLKTKYSDYMASVELRVAEIRDGTNGINGTPGKDADEENIIKGVVAKLPEELPKYGELIRNALELLKNDERLDISAIKGLEDYIKENMPLGGGGGGFSYIAMNRHFVESATPAETVNGTNKIFTLSKAPNPTTSLKFYMNGQRMQITEDYTLVGLTVTFVTAPLTGSILMYDLRY